MHMVRIGLENPIRGQFTVGLHGFSVNKSERCNACLVCVSFSPEFPLDKVGVVVAVVGCPCAELSLIKLPSFFCLPIFVSLKAENLARLTVSVSVDSLLYLQGSDIFGVATS